jgi:hypothetical protein
MITSLAVGAEFVIEDRATPVLVRLAEQMENLQRLTDRTMESFRAMGEQRFGSLSQSLAALERRMTTISSSAERMGVAFAESTGVMTAALAESTTAIGAMAAEMRAVAVSTRAIAGGGGVGAAGGAAAAARGGGGGHARGPFYAPVGAGPVRGHMGVGVAEGAGLVAGFGLYEGIKQAAEQERAFRFAVMADQIDPDSDRGQMLLQRMRQTSTETTHGTIFSRTDVAKMMPTIAGMSGQPLADILPMMPSTIRYAEFEKQLGASMGKSWGSEESASAAIKLGHSMGIIDAPGIERMTNLLVPATQTGDVSPTRLMNVLQYMVAPGRGVGMSEREVIELGALGSLVMPGTRAGTSIGMMLQKVAQVQTGPLPGMGKMALHHLDFMTDSMIRMGLIDPKTHQLFRDEQGGVAQPLLDHLQNWVLKNPGKALGELTEVFENRGGRGAYELAQGKVPTLYGDLEGREDRFQASGGVRGAQGRSMENFLSQVQSSWARLHDVLGDIADPLLPGLTSGFSGLRATLEALDDRLVSNRTEAGAVGVAAGGGLIASLWALISKLSGGRIPGPVAGVRAASGAITGATALAGAAMFLPDSWLPEGMVGTRATAFDSVLDFVHSAVTGRDRAHWNLHPGQRLGRVDYPDNWRDTTRQLPSYLKTFGTRDPFDQAQIDLIQLGNRIPLVPSFDLGSSAFDPKLGRTLPRPPLLPQSVLDPGTGAAPGHQRFTYAGPWIGPSSPEVQKLLDFDPFAAQPAWKQPRYYGDPIRRIMTPSGPTTMDSPDLWGGVGSGGQAVRASPQGVGNQAGHAGTAITVHVSVSGVVMTLQEVVAKVLAALAPALARALANNTGTAGGFHESAHTAGGPPDVVF